MLPADTRAGWFRDFRPAWCRRTARVGEPVAAQNPGSQPIQAGICDKVDSRRPQRVPRDRGRRRVDGQRGDRRGAHPDQVRAAFPDIDPNEFLGTYVERAKTALQISYRDMDWFERSPYFQYARVGRSMPRQPVTASTTTAAPTLRLHATEEAAQVPRSALDFERQYGNNHGRFGSVDQTYIAAALKTGKVNCARSPR